jgi:photosystem II stability/assembly factor-like uncharacterized protein
LTRKLQIAFLLLITSFCFSTHAQTVSIEVLQQGNSFKDSSYYDIMQVGEKYWIGGKYGILQTIDDKGNLSAIDYPSEKVDIYKFDRFDEQNIIACGDKGVIYKHNLTDKTWKTIKVKGYENSCFYNMVVVNSTKVYICGGKSKIAHSGKTVPNGFILESNDGGISWKRIYFNPFQMVWCVKYNPFNERVYALMYTPNKTKLFVLNDEKWKKKNKIGKNIFHEVQFLDKDNYVATGGWIGKKGEIYHNRNRVIIPGSGLLWGRVAGPKYDIYSACDGQIVLDDKSGNFQVFGAKLNKAFSIYETIFTSAHTAIAIGSARTILMIKIEDPASEVGGI